jgi:hypothetical protein
MDKQLLFVGIFFVSVLPILMGIAAFILAVIKARRDPPLAESIARDYATKADMKITDDLARAAATKEEIRTIELRVFTNLSDIRAEYSTLMGEFRRETRETENQIFNLIRTLTAGTERSFRDIENTLGRIEGQLKNHLAEDIARQC